MGITTRGVAGFALVIFLFCSAAFSAPMMPIATMTITGTIESISWYPAQFVPGEPGMSGSAGGDRVIPSHYVVLLVDTTVEARGEGHVPYHSGDAIRIKLNHPADDGYLQSGMKVRIVDFRMGGDEGGIHTSFEAIDILSR